MHSESYGMLSIWEQTIQTQDLEGTPRCAKWRKTTADPVTLFTQHPGNGRLVEVEYKWVDLGQVFKARGRQV